MTTHTLENLDPPIESWMDVLLLGLKHPQPEGGTIAGSISSERPDAPIPDRSLDLIALSFKGPGDLPRQRAITLRSRLRSGGRLAVFLATDNKEQVKELHSLLIATGFEEVVSQVGSRTAQLVATNGDGQQRDLLGLRRAMDRLASVPDELESEILNPQRRDRMTPSQVYELKKQLASIGDEDRFEFFATIAECLALDRQSKRCPGPLAETGTLAHRSVAELLARIRHFRWHSVEHLRKLEADSWLKRISRDSRSVTVAELLRIWAREEQATVDLIYESLQIR